jgi:hypothetical protein
MTSIANIPKLSIGVSPTWSDYPLIVGMLSPIRLVNQRDLRYATQHIKKLLANLGAASTWFTRSFERWRSPAAGSVSDVGADAVGCQVQRVVRRGM